MSEKQVSDFLNDCNDKAVQQALVDLLIENGYIKEADLKDKILYWQKKVEEGSANIPEESTEKLSKSIHPTMAISKKMLIVDDLMPIRQMIQRAVQTLGINNIAEANNGQEALAVFDKFSPDIVLLDIEMKGMNGIEVLQSIRSKSNVPVIIMTGNPNKQYVQDAVKSGMTDFLVKPIDVNRLRQVIEQVLFSTN